jgi:5-formyltetrahydrofolate cyclo-ligase
VTSKRTDKQDVRQEVWDRLERESIARFPFPPHGRIPNFAGAREAAERLLDDPLLRDARRIKVNPDAPQLPVRRLALERGIVVYMPTPRLRAGFLCLDPARIPKRERARAASLSHARRHAREVPLEKLPTPDVLVVGSVAVTRRGGRCGKGEGYADLEYGLLRELGHPRMPVATTVHPVQLVPRLPRDATDLPLDLVVTPEATWRVARPARGPDGIDWRKLPPERLEAMPVLAELRERVAKGRASGARRSRGG